MLKRMFKQLDPAVMKTTNDVQGELKIAIKYLPDKSMLLVKVGFKKFYCLLLFIELLTKLNKVDP